MPLVCAGRLPLPVRCRTVALDGGHGLAHPHAVGHRAAAAPSARPGANPRAEGGGAGGTARHGSGWGVAWRGNAGCFVICPNVLEATCPSSVPVPDNFTCIAQLTVQLHYFLRSSQPIVIRRPPPLGCFRRPVGSAPRWQSEWQGRRCPGPAAWLVVWKCSIRHHPPAGPVTALSCQPAVWLFSVAISRWGMGGLLLAGGQEAPPTWLRETAKLFLPSGKQLFLMTFWGQSFIYIPTGLGPLKER